MASAFKTKARGERSRRTAAQLAFEPLEPRLTLAAAGLVPVGSQPTGALTGKIVYTSGGHGWHWSSGVNRWATDRREYQEIVEDFGNQDQLTCLRRLLVPCRRDRRADAAGRSSDQRGGARQRLAGVTYTGIVERQHDGHPLVRRRLRRRRRRGSLPLRQHECALKRRRPRTRRTFRRPVFIPSTPG